jgi:hypothetical protein
MVGCAMIFFSYAVTQSLFTVCRERARRLPRGCFGGHFFNTRQKHFVPAVLNKTITSTACMVHTLISLLILQ